MLNLVVGMMNVRAWVGSCSIVVLGSCGDDASPSSGESGGQTSAASSAAATQASNPGDETAVASGGGDSSTTETLDPMGMSFFVTSVGSGPMGGDLGGLAAADAWCQDLAAAVGQGARTWHAYLSTTTEDARDRIGEGPWYNANGDMVAADVQSLHADGISNGDPQHIVDENGTEVPGSEYDIITGSEADGTLFEGRHCENYTDNTGEVGVRVGHSSIPNDPATSASWNSAHNTPGCTAAELIESTGVGRIYCFAID